MSGGSPGTNSNVEDPIPVHKIAQEELGVDYECELVFVIGKTARDVPEYQALDYVLGYCAGNDVTHRDWQLKKGGGQWCVFEPSNALPRLICVRSLGKGFDGWAPMGPAIVTPELIPDPQNLRISTKVCMCSPDHSFFFFSMLAYTGERSMARLCRIPRLRT